MSNRNLTNIFSLWSLLYLTLLLVVGCNTSFQEVHRSEIPAIVGRPDSQEVDMNVVVQNVTPQIQEIVPNAQLSGIVFSGNCKNLSQLHGKIVLSFVGTQFSVPFERVISAVASVDTVQQTTDIRVRDVTDFYWSTDALDIEKDDLNLDKIAAIALKQIKALGLANCDVTITRLANSWRVRCGALGNFIQECQFEIHTITGQIILPEK